MAIEVVTTNGIFALDDGEWEVTNNIWLLGDDRQVLVIDAAHNADRIDTAINGRRVKAIVLTHGHNDHINAAMELQYLVDAPIYLHPADQMLWEAVYPGTTPDRTLSPGDVITAGGISMNVLHTPGHSPGCCFFRGEAEGVVFSGDTLFCGGPGATGRSFSDEPTIIESIRTQLLTLPPETIVHTGHGDSTTIGAERTNPIFANPPT
jgi:glyoxylase-like metal-dependent hydrolase (beta-lactamase superfamily II)